MESAKQAVIAGGGVTFLSLWAIRNELERGDLAVVPVDGFEIKREFYTFRSRTRVMSRAAEALLAFFREQYEAGGGLPAKRTSAGDRRETPAHAEATASHPSKDQQ